MATRDLVIVSVYFGSILALLILALFVTTVYADIEAYNFNILKHRGIESVGQVERLSVESIALKKVSCERHLVDYSFRGMPTRNSTGAIFRSSEAVAKSEFDRLSVGSQVPIVFDPRKPARVMLNFDHKLENLSPLTVWKAFHGTRCPTGSSFVHGLAGAVI